MRSAILIIASFIVASAAHAQTWRLQESAKTLKGTHHELLPRPGGEILTITHPDPGHKGPMIISRFDAQLNELYSRRLNLLNQEQYEDAWYVDNRLFLFTVDSYGGLTRYELDDQTGSLIGTPLPLTALLGIDGNSKKAGFYSGHSVAGNYHYIAATTGTTLHGILFNALGDKLTTFEYGITTKPTDLIQTGHGDLCIVYNNNLLHVTATGTCQMLALSGLPDDARNISWWADSLTLHFSALCGSKPVSSNGHANTAFTDIFTGSVDPTTGMLSGCRHTDVATLANPAQQPQTRGLPQSCTLLRQLPLSDGSALILFENTGRRLYQNQWSAAMQNPVSTLGRAGAGGFTPISARAQGASYLSRGDIYVLKVDAANIPQWLDIVAKDQEESDRLTAIGAGCLVDSSDNLHVFFYEDPHNNKFACITIAPGGVEKKQFIAPADNRYRLMPEIAFVDNKDQACFLAIRAKQGFSNELAFDFAGYKLGVIRIE